MSIYDTSEWTGRRYHLPSYDKKALDSIIQARVKEQGLSIKRARSWYVGDILDAYFIPPEARDRGEESLAVRYRAPTLYVYTSNYLPETLKDINETVIAPYVDQRGGTAFPEGPHVYSIPKGWSPHKAFETHINSSPFEPPQPPSASRTGEYDVFVSYRRDRGAEVARLISNALKEKGKHVYLDVNDVPAGQYGQALLTAVENTPNFVVVLTPHALDRSMKEKDWLRQEIAKAIETKSNIVPVMMPKFCFPEQQELPADIRDVPEYQAVPYSHDFFDAMIAKLIKYLRV